MSNTTNNTKDNHKEQSSELIERVPLPWSPFTIVGTPERGYFIAFGKYQLTTPMPTKAEAVEQLEKEKWQVHVTVAGLVQEMMIEEESKRLAAEMKGNKRPDETPEPNGLVDIQTGIEDMREHNKRWREQQAIRERELEEELKKEQN